MDKREYIKTYFDKIETEAKAYFLGLIITDGNISDAYLTGKNADKDTTDA